MTLPITSSLSPKCVYQGPIPTCSSSNMYEQAPEPIQSDLRSTLFENGFIDEFGVITQKAIDQWTPPPLGEAETKRLRELNELVAYGKITFKQCLQFLYRLYGEELSDPLLVGGAVLWVLGWEYYVKALAALGITVPEKFLTDEHRQKWEQKARDADIKIKTSTKLAVSFPLVENDFKHMLEGKLRNINVPTSPSTHLNNLKNVSINLRLENFEFILWNKLRSPYLFGHKAIQLSCRLLLNDDDTPVIPQADSIHLLQAIVDELLMRLNPYRSLNPQGITRIALALTEGYAICDPNTWFRCLKYRYKHTKESGVGALLSQKLQNLSETHPNAHPVGSIFNTMNSVMLFGSNFKRSDVEALSKNWSDVDLNNLRSLHPSLYFLASLWKKGSLLSSSLLPLAAFFWELFSLDERVCSKLLFTNGVDECIYQLQFTAEDGTTLCLQTGGSLTLAYEKLVTYCVRVKDQSLLEGFVNSLIPLKQTNEEGRSRLQDHWKQHQMQWRELRKRVLNHLHHSHKALRAMNVYILCALHELEPLPVTENALLEHVPLIQTSCHAPLMRTLGGYHAQWCQHYLAAPATNCSVEQWIKVLLYKLKAVKVSKLVLLFPRYQKHLTDTEFTTLLLKTTQALLESHAEQALLLFYHSFCKIEKLEIQHFTLFCKVIFPYINSQYQPIFKAHLAKLGEMLLRILRECLQSVNSTTARERVLLHIIDALLDHDDPVLKSLGGEIVKELGKDHPLAGLIGIHLHYLNEKAFPVIKAETIPTECLDKIQEVKTWIAKKNHQRAIKEARQLISTHHKPTTRAVIEQVLFELWDCLKGKVHTDMFSFVYALELIHNETVIQHYLYFCLEAHLKLIELMECSCEKYRTTTNHDFLVASLKFFYTEIPKRLLESYTRTIVKIFNLSWSPGDHPLTVECRELIQTHHLKMLSALREDEETRARLTTQLYNAGLTNLLRGEQDVFKTVERVLTLPEAAPPTQLTQLKIAKKMYSETHPTLSNDLLLLFSKRCLMFHLYQDGVEWLDIVLQHKHPFHQNHKDEIVAILTLLKEEKTTHFLLPRLFQCIELFDDLNPLAHFLSDNFIRNHPDKILTILEMEKASSLERDTIFLILKCLGNELVISSMAEDAVWIRFFKLIVHFKIQLNDSWLGLCYRLRTVKSKRSIAQCVQLFRSAVTDNLIEEGSKRANCFNNLTHEWCRTSESFAITCLQSIPFLQTVYWIPEQKIIDPMVFKYLTIVLNQFVDKSLPFKGNALLEIYQTVYGLPRCSVGNIYLWYFDLTFLRAVKEHLTLEIFDCIKDRLMERLNDLQTINSDDKYIHNAIAQFFLLQLQDLQHAEHLHASFDLFVHQFGDQFWFVVSMLQAMLYVNPNPVIAFGNDSRTIYLQNQIENVLKRYLANTPELNVEHQTIFCINLNSLIGKRGKTHFRWIYRLLLMEETKQVVGADWKPLLETLAKTASTHTVIAADSEPNEDLFIPIEHTREYLDVFFPIDSSFDIDIQKTIWTNTVLTHTHQALLWELNKKSECSPYAFFTEICEYTYSSGVAGKCFYTNVRAFINTMLNILKSQKYASKLVHRANEYLSESGEKKCLVGNN